MVAAAAATVVDGESGAADPGSKPGPAVTAAVLSSGWVVPTLAPASGFGAEDSYAVLCLYDANASDPNKCAEQLLSSMFAG